MTSISIVVPVLNRPANAQPLVDSVRSSTTLSWELLFMVSPGDRAEEDACVATGCRVVVVPWAAGVGDYARKINAGFKMTDGTFVFLGADDLFFHSGWDTAALACCDESTYVIGTNDLGNAKVKAGKHSTHSLVHRGYVEANGLTWDSKPGVVYSDAYAHQYVDTELVSVAIERGIFKFCRESVVEHLHPLWQKSAMDDTYRKALKDGLEDRRMFEFRRRELSGRDSLA